MRIRQTRPGMIYHLLSPLIITIIVITGMTLIPWGQEGQSSQFMFHPIAVEKLETQGPLNESACDLLSDIGRRIAIVLW